MRRDSGDSINHLSYHSSYAPTYLHCRSRFPVSVIIDDLYFKISWQVSTSLKARQFGRIQWDSFGENWNPYSAVIKKLYASKEVKEIALASEGKSCRPENNNYSQSIYMSRPLRVKHVAKITFAQYKCRTFQSIISPADKIKTTLLE